MEDFKDFFLTLTDKKKFIKLWKKNYFLDHEDSIDKFIYLASPRLQKVLELDPILQTVYKELNSVTNLTDYNRNGFTSLWRSGVLQENKESLSKYIKKNGSTI